MDRIVVKSRISLRIVLTISLLLGLGSYQQAFAPPVRAEEHRNPWNHLNFPDRSQVFQFAVVGDRGGGRRPGVFKNALARLKGLSPSFVMSVGDLLDTRDLKLKPDLFDEKAVENRWVEFNSMIEDLPIPFFYVPGNNDIRNVQMEGIWGKHFGRTYYKFIYQDALFIILNSEDRPGSDYGAISDVQLEWLRTTLSENGNVRWTFLFLHKPMWLYPFHPAWTRVEKLLGSRPRTVFGGHHHRYTKSVVNGHAYYGLATTGGSSALSGVTEGQFDHVVWVTMTDEGPRILNLLLEGLWGDNPAQEIRK